MQCACGGEITSSSHEVKTKKTAIEWAENCFNENSDLPLTVESYKCNGCTRFAYKVFNINNILLKKFNV